MPERNSPDFVIAGAMKSGTTALKHVLNRHQGIYLPQEEVHFMNFDDVFQHPDFFISHEEGWVHPGSIEDKRLSNWHETHFSDCDDSLVIGEDSPTLLASPHLFGRVYENHPDLKWLLMLRNPVERAYSNYWHLFYSGRIGYSFEKAIQYSPFDLLYRSCYYEQIASLLQVFPRNQVCILMFDDWKEDPEEVIATATSFLGVKYSASEMVREGTRFHETLHRRFYFPQLAYNKLMRGRARRIYRDYLPHDANLSQIENSFFKRGIHFMHERINPKCRAKPKPMNPSTREMLTSLFAARLDGLDELTGQDSLKRWGLHPQPNPTSLLANR